MMRLKGEESEVRNNEPDNKQGKCSTAPTRPASSQHDESDTIGCLLAAFRLNSTTIFLTVWCALAKKSVPPSVW